MDVATLLGWYEQMAVIRGTEKAAHDLFLRGLVKGTTHLAAGHEAVAVGASAALRPDDYVFATYRGHHHAIARGASPEGCLAELMQRRTGVCRAKGGSMHLTQADHGMLGSYAIVGAHLPMAAGAAWSAQLRGTGQVAVAFFGDGATNIGAFHEALNLASVWKLPVVFVCENNRYMEYTPIDSVTSVPNPAADRAAANGMPGDARRRQRRRCRARRHVRRGAPGSLGSGAQRARGADLPALRAQPHRPRHVPARRGGRRSGSPATRSWWPAGASRCRARRRPTSTPPRSGRLLPSPPPSDAALAAAPADPDRGVHRRVGRRGSAWRT